MRTRNGSYPSASDGITFTIRPSLSRRSSSRGRSSQQQRPAKRIKMSIGGGGGSSSNSGSPFDSLPDDLLISIMAAVSASAARPADLVNTMLACRRLCAAATHPQVLAAASLEALAVRSSAWSDGAHRFLKQCSDAGNPEACYILGAIRFYCLGSRGGGASLMAKAAMASHAPALHSLAVIQFNGSGGSRKDKDLKAGVALVHRAASLGHVDAMRELGHCLQDGYGVPQNVAKGRALLLEANTREAAAAISQSPRRFVEAALQVTAKSGAMACLHHHLHFYCAAAAQGKAAAGALKPDPQQGRTPSPINSNSPNSGPTSALVSSVSCRVMTLLQGGGCSLLSEFGCNVPPRKLHVANRFLVDWFTEKPPAAGLRLCSHANCGRPETRRHEFRRCSACGCVNYCSRACQALDWKIRHKFDCSPVVDWEEREDVENENDGEEIEHDGDYDMQDDQDQQQQQQQPDQDQDQQQEE